MGLWLLTYFDGAKKLLPRAIDTLGFGLTTEDGVKGDYWCAGMILIYFKRQDVKASSWRLVSIVQDLLVSCHLPNWMESCQRRTATLPCLPASTIRCVKLPTLLEVCPHIPVIYV